MIPGSEGDLALSLHPLHPHCNLEFSKSNETIKIIVKPSAYIKNMIAKSSANFPGFLKVLSLAFQ